MAYKIGQILTSKEDVEVEIALSGKKEIVPKGNKVVIGADGFAPRWTFKDIFENDSLNVELINKKTNEIDEEIINERLFKLFVK